MVMGLHKEECVMDYKTMVADIIVYAQKQIELAEFDLNITRDESYQSEIEALYSLLLHIESLLGSDDIELEKCMSLVRDVLGEFHEREGNEHLD